MRLVVFGWGNDSRGDDGFGPELLRRIEAAGLEGVATVEDFQLQIEHALDLEGADLALFIDAARGGPAPFAFGESSPRRGLTHTTHALAPEAVLDVYRQVRGAAPPPAFVLGVRGESFGLGEGLSPVGAERLEAAWAFVAELLREPDASAWRAIARQREAAAHALPLREM